MKEFISFGGGVNSVAMLLLLRDQGNDAEAVFADHHSDWPETYEYLDVLESRGFSVTRLPVGSLYDWYWDSENIPTRWSRWCTNHFKLKPLRTYMAEESGGEWLTYIGFSTDEAHRAARGTTAPGETKAYPLIDEHIDRDGCHAVIRDHGLPVPRRSGCWFCPFARVRDFRELKRTHPELICKVRALEERCNARLAREKPDMSPIYIKDKPIQSVVDMDQLDLFGEELPCVCMT